ncbi:NAD(P)/FAD-dependent oxidoreductase [Pseudaminobacter soli (ex Li et al. 2025)]|uniref:FAD-dependent oxidoreductase n=1 Tax=Pseudaminobacter soli (ex Li et al. 2025) TaxID=1295366 RepID=A0A2P7S0Q5_9HYPH|nr:FAD-binding oxidoreductase [Mesorhizobium soli]PSJ56048.1 FAD-dependent oxidoreductase [Mesorhizobium soli]
MQIDPRSHGLWEKTAPKAPLTSILNESVSADVVIVGGGFTGFSTALHLAKLNVTSIVLEAVEIGFGGSGRNVGLVNAGLWIMPDDVLGILGQKHGERCLKALSDAPKLVRDVVDEEEIPCELVRNGTLHLAANSNGLSELKDRYAQWSARGVSVELLDGGEAERRTGSSAYCGALFDPRAGTIQPLAYVRGLAKAAIKKGIKAYTQSPVIAAERSGAGWLVRTRAGSVAAKWVVVATDAYSVGPWEIVRDEQVHLPYFNFATAPLSDNLQRTILPGREGCWDTKDILSSFRMDQQGRLVFGSVGALRNTGRSVHRAWAKRSLKQLFPQLGDVEFEAEWYGKIGMTTDAAPRFHRLDEHVVGFSGYNGRGIAPGTAFGKLLASYVAGQIDEEDLPLPVTEAKAQSLRTVKEAYYEVGAQVAHMAGARF